MAMDPDQAKYLKYMPGQPMTEDNIDVNATVNNIQQIAKAKEDVRQANDQVATSVSTAAISTMATMADRLSAAYKDPKFYS